MIRSATLMAATGLAMVLHAPLLAQDAQRGAEVFRKCKACHQVGEEAKQRTGPVLNGIVGGPVAAREGFSYSDALTAFAKDQPRWSADLLDSYLEKPRAVVRGTRMGFAGLRRPGDRADVIAYLATFGSDGAPAEAGFAVAPEVLAMEGDADYGAYLSGECTTCHQTSGEVDGIPAIVGLGSEHFVTAMHAYRAGAREHPVMQMIAGRLSDEQIAALAAYFKDLEN